MRCRKRGTKSSGRRQPRRCSTLRMQVASFMPRNKLTASASARFEPCSASISTSTRFDRISLSTRVPSQSNMVAKDDIRAELDGASISSARRFSHASSVSTTNSRWGRANFRSGRANSRSGRANFRSGRHQLSLREGQLSLRRHQLSLREGLRSGRAKSHLRNADSRCPGGTVHSVVNSARSDTRCWLP